MNDIVHSLRLLRNVASPLRLHCFCYLPLYVFCCRHLLAAKLRRSNIDASSGAVEEVERIIAQIRKRWPRVRILLRADSGFAREALMAWCEANRVDFLFGLARNERLVQEIKTALVEAAVESVATGKAARRDRRPRARQCTAGEDRNGFRLSLAARIRARSRLAGQRRSVTRTRKGAPHTHQQHRSRR
jgi:hypothetical protein